MSRCLVANLLVAAMCITTCAVAADSSSLALTLPPVVNVVVGHEQEIFFRNLVLTDTPEQYRFVCACDIGNQTPTAWQVNPTSTQVGDHTLQVTVQDSTGKALDHQQTTVHVVPADAGHDRSLRLLIVGDSLTHATWYPNRVATLLNEPGNPHWTMLGTNSPTTSISGGAVALPGVRFEGYGGWSWTRFLTWYDSSPAGTDRTGPHWWVKISSPFVFPDQQGHPQLDVPRYFREHCDGQPPDLVVFLLGANDTFHSSSGTRAQIDAKMDQMFTNADRLLVAFRAAAPHARFGIGLIVPCNVNESAFTKNYKGSVTRAQWQPVRHLLAQREIQHFGSLPDPAISLIPTELGLDPVNGFPPDNALHPNPLGYDQLAGTIYAWVKAQMAIPSE